MHVAALGGLRRPPHCFLTRTVKISGPAALLITSTQQIGSVAFTLLSTEGRKLSGRDSSCGAVHGIGGWNEDQLVQNLS